MALKNTELTKDSPKEITVFISWYIDNELGDVVEDNEYEPFTMKLPFDKTNIEDSVYNIYKNSEFKNKIEELWKELRKDKPSRLSIEIERINVENKSYENHEDWEELYYLYWDNGTLTFNQEL